MTFSELCLQIITAFLGSLGFSMLFNVRGSKLFIAGLGGELSWTLYLALGAFTDDDPIKYFIASLFVTVYAEIFARIKKSPTTSFLVPSFIPLIPGGALYNTMKYALNNDWGEFADNASYTMRLALALAAGIVAVSSFMRMYQATVHYLQQHKQAKRKNNLS